MVTIKRLTFLGLSFWILTACHLAPQSPLAQPTISPPPPSISTPTPPIITPDVPADYLENVHIVIVDTFDNPSGWTSADEISNGALLLEGSGGSDWHGLSNRAIFREGTGAVINFQFASGEFFEMYFERGPWTTSLYKRFGVYVNEDHATVNIFTGRARRDPDRITGDLTLQAGIWYSLLMVVGKGGDFLAVIWDPANPENRLQYREVIADWSELDWAFRIQVNKGTILFDDFAALVFDNIK